MAAEMVGKTAASTTATTNADSGHEGHEHAVDGKSPAVENADDVAFYESQIAGHDRSGFIWQKLREPRSYDYAKTHNKRYNERLRMPLFPINAEEREAVMTFVLGLVADPPAEKFVYAGDPRRNAITAGLAVLEKYNCAGCHVLRPETWTLEFAAGEITAPQNPPDFPFLAVDVPAKELDASTQADAYRGLLSAHVQGMPAISNDDASVEIWDEDWEPIDPEEIDDYAADELVYPIQLWQPATVEGQVLEVGARVAVPAGAITKRRPSHGGDLAKYLLSRVTALEKQDNPNANGTESWGWVPPPLIGQGSKVQPGWLHNFLLHPFKIRPAAFLRMPKFNMSPDEATKLVNYFAAVENVDYPFEFDPRMRADHLAESEAEFAGGTNGENRLDHAMKIVTNGNYCVKCHLVGDFMPEGSVRALAPDLAKVETRLRPDYMRRWIANPLKILPYTPMPVNITYNPDDPHLGGVEQLLFPGTSIEQLDGVVDLLAHYGEYMSQKNDIAELVKQAAPAAPPEDANDDQAKAAEEPARVPRTSQRPVVRVEIDRGNNELGTVTSRRILCTSSLRFPSRSPSCVLALASPKNGVPSKEKSFTTAMRQPLPISTSPRTSRFAASTTLSMNPWSWATATDWPTWPFISTSNVAAIRRRSMNRTRKRQRRGQPRQSRLPIRAPRYFLANDPNVADWQQRPRRAQHQDRLYQERSHQPHRAGRRGAQTTIYGTRKPPGTRIVQYPPLDEGAPISKGPSLRGGHRKRWDVRNQERAGGQMDLPILARKRQLPRFGCRGRFSHKVEEGTRRRRSEGWRQRHGNHRCGCQRVWPLVREGQEMRLPIHRLAACRLVIVVIALAAIAGCGEPQDSAYLPADMTRAIAIRGTLGSGAAASSDEGAATMAAPNLPVGRLSRAISASWRRTETGRAESRQRRGRLRSRR